MPHFVGLPVDPSRRKNESAAVHFLFRFARPRFRSAPRRLQGRLLGRVHSIARFDSKATRLDIALERLPENSPDIPADDFWQISGIFGGNRGDIHSSRRREGIAKTLVTQGFSSPLVLVIPCLRSLPKLDVAGSTPVARSTFSPSNISCL